ncbi:hypothetical protein SESBI_24742 [Sesbania bispinosa]|nr:hypothetical protein SESBI_24742 [Sesbania bispinosa]
MVEVRKGRRYGKFDPFILPKTTTRVYYLPYPGQKKDRVDWLIVTKSKPKRVVDDKSTLEVAYQVEESHLNATIGDDPIDHLLDDEIDGEEVDLPRVWENEFIDDDEVEVEFDEELDINDEDDLLSNDDRDEDDEDEDDKEDGDQEEDEWYLMRKLTSSCYLVILSNG